MSGLYFIARLTDDSFEIVENSKTDDYGIATTRLWSEVDKNLTNESYQIIYLDNSQNSETVGSSIRGGTDVEGAERNK